METQTEYELTEKQAPLPAIATTNDVIMAAVQRGYEPAFVEKMMDLAERFEKNEARKAFFEALASFKLEAPKVKKDKRNPNFNSYYTSLGNLLETYNPYLAKHGLSASFPTPQQTDKTVTGECRLSHRMGHSESVSITVPIDQAAIGKASGQRSRNAIQDIKSTFTYLRSVTFEAILGVAGTEASLDDDGNSAAGNEFITEAQAKEINDLLKKTGADVPKFLKYAGAETVDTIPAKAYKKVIIALKQKAKKKSERVPGEEG